MKQEEELRQHNVSKFPEDERSSKCLNVMKACMKYTSEKRQCAYNCGNLI